MTEIVCVGRLTRFVASEKMPHEVILFQIGNIFHCVSIIVTQQESYVITEPNPRKRDVKALPHNAIEWLRVFGYG